MSTAKDLRRVHLYNRTVMETFERKLTRLPWPVVAKDRGAMWHSMAEPCRHRVVSMFALRRAPSAPERLC